MNSRHIRPFSFPCQVPNPGWWDNTPLPVFKTIDIIGYEVLPVNDINYTNEKGQVINTARQVGTDSQNALSLKNSFLNEGIDPSYVPPIVLRDKDGSLQLVEGFTRHSVFIDLAQEKFVYVVGELRVGFTLEDVIDEVGLGCNNHPQSKRHTIKDFKTRLKRWVNSQESMVTENECLKWFDGINHSFNAQQVAKAIDEVINDKLAAETTESLTKTTARQKGIKLLGIHPDDLLTFDNHTGASLDTCLVNIIKQCDSEGGRIPTVVGYTKKVPAEDVPLVRKSMKLRVDTLNAGLRLMARNFNAADKRGEGDAYEFIKLEGFLPQIVDKEDEIIRY